MLKHQLPVKVPVTGFPVDTGESLRQVWLQACTEPCPISEKTHPGVQGWWASSSKIGWESTFSQLTQDLSVKQFCGLQLYLAHVFV